MPEQFDKEVLLLLIVFTAKEDILCLFVAVEQLKKSRFRCQPVNWTIHRSEKSVDIQFSHIQDPQATLSSLPATMLLEEKVNKITSLSIWNEVFLLFRNSNVFCLWL